VADRDYSRVARIEEQGGGGRGKGRQEDVNDPVLSREERLARAMMFPVEERSRREGEHRGGRTERLADLMARSLDQGRSYLPFLYSGA